MNNNYDYIWRNVEKSEGCWIWKGKTQAGYGIISKNNYAHRAIYEAINGYGKTHIYVNDQPKSVFVHRLVYEIAHGPIPNGFVICHKCDNPPCCRLDHLFLGTHADNVTDSVQKMRRATGTKNGKHTHPELISRGSEISNSKLNDDNVREIRRRNALGEGQRKLAKEFGVCKTNIANVVNGRTWTHIL